MSREIDWFAVGAGRWSMQVAATPAPAPPLSADSDQLEAEWLRVRREVELAMDRGMIPGSGYVYDPRLEILRGRIRERWANLDSSTSLGELLALVRKFHENTSAAIFGYAFLRAALLLRGDSYQAEHVADFEVAFMSTVGITTHPSENPDVVKPQAQAMAGEDDEDEDDL